MKTDKFVRFFLIEPSSRNKVFLVAGLIVLMIFEIKVLQIQSGKIKKALNEKELVSQIPDLERKIEKATKTPSLDKPIDLSKKEAIEIQGIVIKDNVPYVLISDEIYEKGQILGRFKIIDITRYMAVLENQENQERINLYLPQAALFPELIK